MKKQVYFVTGAAGHLGSVIVSKLLALGKYVIGLILPTDKSSLPEVSNFMPFYGDVLDIDSLDKYFRQEEDSDKYVIHTAGLISIDAKFSQKMYDVNVIGTTNVVQMCEKYQVKKLVHVSSVHAIPELPKKGLIKEIDFFEPKDVRGPYAKTKSEATQVVLDAAKRGLNASVVHPSGIIGPFDYSCNGNLTHMIIDYVNHKLPTLVKGGYDFVDVRDVADGIISCIEKGRSGECYILSNQYFEVLDILNVVRKTTKQKPFKHLLPMWFARFTAVFAEMYYKSKKLQPLFTRYSLYTLTSNANFTHQKATEELNYKTRPIEETVSDLLKFLLEIGKISY